MHMLYGIYLENIFEQTIAKIQTHKFVVTGPGKTLYYTALHCGKPGRRTCMFSYEPFTAILEVPEVSPEVVWLLWVVGEALGTTSAPLKAQKPAKTS